MDLKDKDLVVQWVDDAIADKDIDGLVNTSVQRAGLTIEDLVGGARATGKKIWALIVSVVFLFVLSIVLLMMFNSQHNWIANINTNPCATIKCEEQPSDTCDSGVLNVASTGICVEGTCHYPTVQVPCESGECLEGGGACAKVEFEQTNPCEGKVCNTPPANTCVDGLMQTWSKTGICDGGGVCNYQAVRSVCSNGCTDDGTACAEAICSDTRPCPAGQACSEGVCYTSCIRNEDCGEGEVCEDKLCLQEDTEDAKTEDTECDPTGANTTHVCPAGQVCSEGWCYVACTTNANCGEGQACDEGLCLDLEE